MTNKHLLPVGSYPMVYHPLKKLVGAGVQEVLLVSGTRPDAISWAVEAITTSKLNGNVALVTADEHVSTLSVRQESAVNVTTIRDSSPLWIAVIAGVIALALVGVTIFLALRSMRTQTQEAH